MLRWLKQSTPHQQQRDGRSSRGDRGSKGASRDESPPRVTDDPLATIQSHLTPKSSRHIYSVSRSVVLPRVALRNSNSGGGVNPMFVDSLDCSNISKNSHSLNPHKDVSCETLSPATTDPSSSGYGSHGGSSHDPVYADNIRLKEDAVAILEQNANFVKSILVAVKNRKKGRRSVASLGSSGQGTLSTIPEGKVDFSSIPKPIWPHLASEEDIEGQEEGKEGFYDSIVDDALLLYTAATGLSGKNKEKQNEKVKKQNTEKTNSAGEILREVARTVNAAVEGKMELTPEQVLKTINERLSSGLEQINKRNEDDFKRLSRNLSNSEHLRAVVRAFSNSTSTGSTSNCSTSSPEWSRIRTNSNSSTSEDIYLASSSSCTMSDKNIYEHTNSISQNLNLTSQIPVFVHDDLCSVSNGVRNAMIYGTLCKNNLNLKNSLSESANERLLDKNNKLISKISPLKSSILASPDDKPSVWEIYYGAGMDNQRKGESPNYALGCSGRPEADFTLDVPRSELLSRRMKQAKKWRFRCRIVTSFLGLLFFLLSLMAVSLMLTRGKRMFGSML